MIKKPIRFVAPFLTIAVIAGLAFAGYLTRQTWMPWLQHGKPVEPVAPLNEAATPSEKVIVSEQAQRNLGLAAKPLKAQTYWKTIQVPGMVVDRPGKSDRSVTSPVAGVIAKVAHVPGDTVRPGDVLFTIKLLSESLHLTQTDLFKATQDIILAEAQRKRMAAAADAIAGARIIEVESQITRLQVAAKAYRRELLDRGFSSDLIDGVAEGTFVSEIPIVVPPRPDAVAPLTDTPIKQTSAVSTAPPLAFEIQELNVELGQQVQAGQTLCLLANHQALAVEGRAFRDETPLLERSVKEGWPVDVDFQEEGAPDWPPLDQSFRIRHMANIIDPVNRTFAFWMPLDNQSRTVEDDGRTQMLWRFRPGQKVRLLVRVEKLDNVFVLPADAVSREGPEAFIFTQNVNTFERKQVHVLLQDRQHVVLANDGALPPGSFVVQSAAAQLNRMVKAGSSGVPKGYHIHADGSLHKNEDEGK
ncbi:MAG: efflux RND transporter periplasmic adaptor subunit [Planctomycetaceae bacterium]